MSRKLLRLFLALVALFACVGFILDAGRAGIARFFTAAAVIQSTVEPADVAVRIAPTDPEAHYTRGLELVNWNRTSEAVMELRQATQLRPHHYYEWLDLGVTLDRLGDQAGALRALKESVRLAPFFAQPRWQLGNSLYRQASYDDAFKELRLGVRSDPSFMEILIDLAWVAADGNVERMVSLVAPQDRLSRLQLAKFLERHGDVSAAVQQVKEAGAVRSEDEIALTHETISDLLSARHFSEAYQIWMLNHPGAGGAGTIEFGHLLNGDFVEPIIQNDPGFGWQSRSVTNVSLSIDPAGPGAGARSVRLDFHGDNETINQLLNQIVPVQQRSRYSLRFMARTESLMTGGPPVVAVIDANSDNSSVLAQSTVFASGNSPWTPYTVNFSTDDKTFAVIVALQRTSCTQSPCPIFGKLWLSQFALEKTGISAGR